MMDRRTATLAATAAMCGLATSREANAGPMSRREAVRRLRARYPVAGDSDMARFLNDVITAITQISDELDQLKRGR